MTAVITAEIGMYKYVDINITTEYRHISGNGALLTSGKVFNSGRRLFHKILNTSVRLIADGLRFSLGVDKWLLREFPLYLNW